MDARRASTLCFILLLVLHGNPALAASGNWHNGCRSSLVTLPFCTEWMCKAECWAEIILFSAVSSNITVWDLDTGASATATPANIKWFVITHRQTKVVIDDGPHNSPPLLSHPSPLRVHEEAPGRSRALSGGVASRRWRRRGAGVGFRSRFFCSSLVVGFLPGRRRGARDLGAQIRRVLGFLLLALLLRWPELGEEGRTTVSMNIFVAAGCLEMQVGVLVFFLAGRGGEGEGRHDAVCCAAELLLTGRGGEGEWRRGAASPASRWWLCPPEVGAFGVELLRRQDQAPLPPSSRHGGGTEEDGGLALLQVLEALRGGGCANWHPPEASFFCGGSQRRRQCPVAIYGKRSHSELECAGRPSLFFLLVITASRRIYLDLDLGVHASLAPSGAVPGGEAGAQTWRSPVDCGEDKGPDRVFSLFSEVLFVKVEGYVVISFFPWVLDVNCTPL